MPKPDLTELRRIQIDPDLLSRGTGSPVVLQEAVVYDFMPPILGNRFRVDEILKRGVHFFSDVGSFMMGEEAFQELATQELDAGNLVFALEAYKRGLHKAVGFAGAMTRLGDRALLSQTEIDRFDLPRRFGTIERRSISAIIKAGEDTKIDLLDYAEWVAGVRRLERDASQLNQQYFDLTPKYPDNDFSSGDSRIWERDTSLMGNPETGTKLRDTYAQMQRYQYAAWISGKVGDKEAEVRYAELAKTDPQDPPGYGAILYEIEKREERYRYPERFGTR